MSGDQRPKGSKPSNLRLIHDKQSLAASSLAYWRSKSTEYIIDSLSNSANIDYEALVVKSDGTVLNGNTRLFVLDERSIDIDGIDRTTVD